MSDEVKCACGLTVRCSDSRDLCIKAVYNGKHDRWWCEGWHLMDFEKDAVSRITELEGKLQGAEIALRNASKPQGDLLTNIQRGNFELYRASFQKMDGVCQWLFSLVDSLAPKPAPQPDPLPKCRLCGSEAMVTEDGLVCCSKTGECTLNAYMPRADWIAICGDKEEEKKVPAKLPRKERAK